MKIAIIHDYLIANAGAEKCLLALLEIYPKADIYSLFYDKSKFKYLSKYKVKTSFLNHLPFLKKRHQIFLPLYPLAIESLNLKGYDLIISSSWGWSKGIKKDKRTCHISYCYTPLRFVHYRDMLESRLARKKKPIRFFAEKVVKYLKAWDIATAKNVDYFIATCNNVKSRIKKFYSRDSTVINPPTELNLFRLNGTIKKDSFFLVVSRFVPYKKIDLAIEAFNKMKLPLKIVGSGCENKHLRDIAGPNIEFTDYLTQRELIKTYQNCQALVFPQEEDWGITSIEAQACGRPIIAYAKGGALEHVIEGKTGHFFKQQTSEAIIQAVKEFCKMSFDSNFLRNNALKYDREVFKEKVAKFVEEKYKEFKENLKV